MPTPPSERRALPSLTLRTEARPVGAELAAHMVATNRKEVPMSLQDIREILLDQHDALRARIGEARRASELWRRGALAREEMQRLLERLSEQLRAHHACEERLLR